MKVAAMGSQVKREMRNETIKFRRRLLAWYARHRRDLPWRANRDPYRVWISEIMLQQTRVAAVIEHYHEFLRRFPTVEKLSAAREASVLAAWSGLGYYRRARMMHAAAKVIVREHCGEFPTTEEQLRKLPGIGRYTAAAIASIAFGEPVALVDGNVERVLQRLSGKRLTGEELWEAANRLLRYEAPRRLQSSDDGIGRRGVHAACTGLFDVSRDRTLRHARRVGEDSPAKTSEEARDQLFDACPRQRNFSHSAFPRCVADARHVGVAGTCRKERIRESRVYPTALDHCDRLRCARLARHFTLRRRKVDSSQPPEASRTHGTGTKDFAQGLNSLKIIVRAVSMSVWARCGCLRRKLPTASPTDSAWR